MDHALNVKKYKIKDLKVNPANTRRHDDANIQHLKTSLEKYGQRKPVIVQKKGMICRAGNGLLQAATELGWDEIAAVVIDESSVDATGYEIMDNKSAETSEWNNELLAQQLLSLDEDNFDLNLAGFSKEELDVVVEDLEPDTPPEEDEPPEPPEKPKVQAGQLWLLGRKVYCKNCRKWHYLDEKYEN